MFRIVALQDPAALTMMPHGTLVYLQRSQAALLEACVGSLCCGVHSSCQPHLCHTCMVFFMLCEQVIICRDHHAGCIITGFQGSRPPESSPAGPPAAAPSNSSNSNSNSSSRRLLNAPPAAPQPDTALPELVADSYYEEYEPFAGAIGSGSSGAGSVVLKGMAPVAQVQHNSSLVFEDCRIEGNNVRHANGAAISISAVDSDYDALDFPCAVAVRGGVVKDSFPPGNLSQRVRFPPLVAIGLRAKIRIALEQVLCCLRLGFKLLMPAAMLRSLSHHLSPAVPWHRGPSAASCILNAQSLVVLALCTT
jgi:hypothetical protein